MNEYDPDVLVRIVTEMNTGGVNIEDAEKN
jgi:hypothetical protein